MQEFLLLVDMMVAVVSALQKSSTPDLAVAVKLVTYQSQLGVQLSVGTWPVVEKVPNQKDLVLGLFWENSQPCQ